MFSVIQAGMKRLFRDLLFHVRRKGRLLLQLNHAMVVSFLSVFDKTGQAPHLDYLFTRRKCNTSSSSEDTTFIIST